MPEDISVDIHQPERSEAELDALADSGEKGTNRERPMKDTPKEAPAAAAKGDEFEFVHNGKPVKGTREQMIKWASMGYGRPQEVAKWNADKQKWEKDKQDWEQKWGVYRQVDEAAVKNPAWWKHITDGWDAFTKGQGTGTPPPQQGAPPAGLPPEVLQEIQSLRQVVGEIQQDKRAAHEKAEDEQLEKDVRDIRGQYTDLDWESLDETGNSLEMRVMDHGIQNGIKSFKTAFRDLLHDDLINRAASQGKLAVSKGIQTRTKLGVLGESSTSTKGVPPRNRDIRKTSYEELEAEIREELKSMRS